MDILLKISYLIFIISFSIMILAFSFYETDMMDIESIEKLEENDDFRIKAKIVDIKETPGIVFLKIEQNVAKKVTIFKDGQTNFSDFKSKYVIIEGHVNEYKNEKSLLADKIKTIN
ncbi:MAG: hypothetical protein ACQER9_04170 [Nanobdellota archaeon]